MDIDFLDELPTVFNVLKFNPEAIVDDTAIERLLSWLEEISLQKNPRLVEKSLEFFKSEEIWKHSLTLSFALRYIGFLGHQYGSSTTQLVTIVEDMLAKVQKDKQFIEATVQYGFYKCLTSLSKDLFWCKFLENFLDVTTETFKNSYLYVKKAAVGFFSSYLYTLLLNKCQAISIVHNMIECISDSEQLHHITESVFLLSELDVELSLNFLSKGKIIKSLMSSMKTGEGNSRSQLLKSLESLFLILSRNDVQFDWHLILDNPEEAILYFIKDLKNRSELKMLMPSFCKSLMTINKNFSPSWNYNLLQIALSDISYQDNELRNAFDDDLRQSHDVLSVKLWKQLFAVTIGEMINIEKKVSVDPLCQTLLKSWRMFCLKTLNVSLSNDLDKQLINEYLISVMYDKKIPRLCFQYLKELNFETFDGELNKTLLDCLWNCLLCHTDSPQVVCATLELLSRYICQNENNITKLVDYTDIAKSETYNMNYTLADIFNKLLWDTNWEVQDSLIDVLLKILENAKTGSQVCYKFLEQNTFWVKVIDLINNQESYIRSKTVSFIGAVVLYQPTWEIFCRKWEHSMIDLWKLLKEKFVCEERQDDMFTRRSIIHAIKSWILSKLDHVPILLPHSETTDSTSICVSETMRSHLFEILRNGSCDFDWEVRKLTFSAWTDMANVVSERTQKEKGTFLDLVGDNNFALILCNGICDCEYLVKMEAFKCLTFIKNNYKGAFVDTNISPLESTIIQNITEYENILLSYKHMNRNVFENLIGKTNFDELANDLDILDIKVSSDPVSFIQDVIASAKQSEANLLDCY